MANVIKKVTKEQTEIMKALNAENSVFENDFEVIQMRQESDLYEAQQEMEGYRYDC